MLFTRYFVTFSFAGFFDLLTKICFLLNFSNSEQRRTKGDVYFNRRWQAYKEGFGKLDGDFWLGNEAVHILTNAVSILKPTETIIIVPS